MFRQLMRKLKMFCIKPVLVLKFELSVYINKYRFLASARNDVILSEVEV